MIRTRLSVVSLLLAILGGPCGVVHGEAFQEILQLPEGTDDGQVGIILGDLRAYDFLPAIHVDEAGMILVGDTINGRVQIFSSEGDFLRSIFPENPDDSLLFPGEVLPVGGERFVTRTRGVLALYSYQGDMLSIIRGVKGSIESQLSSNEFILTEYGQENFSVYNSVLDYLGQGGTLPDSWYQEDDNTTDDGITVRRFEFADRCYALRDRGASLLDVQRVGGLLFLVGERQVWVIDGANTVLSSARIPESVFGEYDFDPQEDPGAADFEPPVVSQYVTFTLGHDGEMYSIHRSGDVFVFGKWDLAQLPPASDIIQPITSDLALAPLESRELFVGSSLRISLAYTGGSGRDVQFDATDLPPGAKFDELLGIFEWTPLVFDLGQREIEFSVQDDECGFDRQLLVVDVIE